MTDLSLIPGLLEGYTPLYVGGVWGAYQKPAAQTPPTANLDANRTPAPTASPKVVSGPAETLDNVLYGQVIPISGGIRLVRGRALWWSQPRTITTSASSTGTATVMDIAVSFGYPLSSSGHRGILKIKAGIVSASTIIYDMTSTPPVNAIGLNFTFYPGTETQMPDPTIEAAKGVGKTSAYRGQMYAVFKNFPIDLFIENGTVVAPLFAALIADDTFNTVASLPFNITTGTTVLSFGAVDWTGGLIYQWSIARLVVFSLWSQEELFDLPMADVTGAALASINNQGLYVDGLGKLLIDANSISSYRRFMLVDPLSATAVAQGPVFGFVPVSDVTSGMMSWNTDTTGATTVYLFAMLSDIHGYLEIFRYNASTNTITSLGMTAAGLDGHAGTSSSDTRSIVAGGHDASGRAIFYVGSTTAAFKVVVDLDVPTAPYTITTFASIAVNQLYYLPNENTLTVFGPGGAATKYRCSDAAVLWSVTLPFTTDLPIGVTEMQTTETWRRTQPWFAYVASGTWYFVDMNDGSYTSRSGGPVVYRLVFDTVTKSAIMSPGGGTPTMYQFTTSGTGSYAYSDMVLQMATLAGYQAGQVTVTGVTDVFPGIILDQDTDFLNFLSANAELLNYRMVEDQTIRIFRLTDSPSIDFAIDDTMCLDTGRDGPMVVRDEQETSFASKLEIQYRDPVTDYSFNSQTVQRPLIPIPTTASDRKDTIQSPLIMTADQAVTLATPVIYRRAAASTKATVNGLPVLCAAQPGDVITLTQGANVYTAVIQQNRLGGNLHNTITAQVILTKTDFTRLGSAGDAAVFSWSTQNPASTAIFIDGPIISYRTDLGGGGLYYRWVATSIGQTNWPGAQFYYSMDGVSYSSAGVAASTQTVHVGSATTTLADNPTPFMTDYTNTLTLVPVTGDFTTLASVTYAQMMAGQTLAYFGAPGRWEVIAFETVTNNGDGTFSFHGLMRGLYGTEVFSGQHVPGDRFVFMALPDNGMNSSSLTVGSLGSTLYYKAVGSGELVGAATTQTATVSGNAERPPAPVHLDAVISGSDIALSWEKRSRFVQHLTNWNILESETADEWSIDIMSGSTVKRTLTATTTSKTYLAADITTDFGGMPATLKFRVYRIGHDNALSVGRGFMAEKTATL